MPIQDIILWGVVICVGVPSVWWNPTAAALVAAKVGSAIYAHKTGASFTQMLLVYPFFDAFVVAMIVAKDEHCNHQPYRGALHQLKCLVLERLPSDRAVMLAFVVCWIIYVAPLHDYYRWWLLWSLTVLQFLFASAESLEIFWRSRSMAARKAEINISPGSGGGGFLKRVVPAQVNGHPFASNRSMPTLVLGIPRHSGHPRNVSSVHSHILGVRRGGAVTQIFNAVIRRIAINVVNSVRWPLTVVHGPDDPMGIFGSAMNSQRPVKGAVVTAERSGFLASPSLVPALAFAPTRKRVFCARKPKQLSSLRLIAEKLTKRFRGRYFSGSHCEDTFRSGQGRALFEQRFRPAFNNINHSVLQRRGADAAVEPPVSSDSPSALLVAYEGGGYG